MRDYLRISDKEMEHLDDVYKRYKKLYEEPDNCSPMIIVNIPIERPTWDRILEDPLVMLKTQLDQIRSHLELRDDRVPTVRVEFGTAQIAAAFGCDLVIPPDSLPAASKHVLTNAEDVYNLEKPSFDAGWFGKLKLYTEVFLENLPEGVHIQHPDIQSPFNTAHLIRGNDIFLDFYDNPDALEYLLDLVTDYMLNLTPYLKSMISDDNHWFLDWGAMWKGSARISNCSMHMISPELYRRHIMERDRRFLRGIGGGRIHYCGTSGQVIDEFFRLEEVSGLDFDSTYHDLWELCQRAPKHFVLLCHNSTDMQKRLLGGDWPSKKNIIYITNAPSIEEGKELLAKLRQSAE